MEKQSSFKKLYHRIRLIGINWTTKAFGIVNLVVHRSSQMPTQRVIKWKLKQRIMYDTQNVSFTFCILLYPPLPEGGGGYTVLPLSVQDIFRRTFLSNCWWRFWTHQIPTSCLPTLLVFIHIEHICTFFVTFFSATIDGRDLIFGHKLHIGTPYHGKRFLTRQIPTSCLPEERGYHKWALAHSSSCCVI